MSQELIRVKGDFMVRKIVSGGQTGADRAALDWAIQHGIPHGGWCPAGRRAEDGVIPAPYHLLETPKHDYAQRTQWNVRDSDATLIVSLSPELTGGSLATRQWAEKMERPCLHVYPGDGWRERMVAFLEAMPIQILNVAGPRSSGAPGIEGFVDEVLSTVVLETQGG
jgi:hypothetical protein